MLNINEACEFLKISKSTIRRWEKEGVITSIRTSGNHRRYDENELNRILGWADTKPDAQNNIVKTTNQKTNLTFDKIISKWKPILNTLKIVDDSMIRYAATYAEYTTTNYLLVSLLLFSKLQFENKFFEISNPNNSQKISTFRVSTELEKQEYIINTDNYIKFKEDALINQMSSLINKQLKEYNTLVVYELISNITIDEDNQSMILESRISFKNRK